MWELAGRTTASPCAGTPGETRPPGGRCGRPNDPHGGALPGPKQAAPGTPLPAAAAPALVARRALKKRYDKSDLDGTDSAYLCLFCYEPLYIDACATKEVCFNRECVCYVSRGEISGNIAEHDGPRHAKKLYEESVREFYKFDRQFLLQMIHSTRAAESEKLFRKGGMRLGILLSLDLLMTQLDGDAVWGGSRDYRACCEAFDDYYKNFEMVQLAEDICSKYYVTDSRLPPFVIKYYNAFMEVLKTYGIVNNNYDRDACAVSLPFGHIDSRSAGDPPKDAFDFLAFYENSLTLAGALAHAFKMRRTSSKIYAHPFVSADFVTLLSLWATCLPSHGRSITVGELRKTYEGAVKVNKMNGKFEQFLANYTSAKTYAPILVFDGEKYHFDYPSLLLYLIYMFSSNRLRSGRQTVTGQAFYTKMRQNTARSFEDEIRQKLLDGGFDVRPGPGEKPFRPSFDNVRKEFDCVAVDRERKIIVIVEAKYEDMAPSSMSAGTMVDQLVLNRKTGLLAHAKKHHSRRKFFRRHFDGMGQRGLDLPGDFIDYTVYTLLVTKHEPLISRHMAVDILSYEKFLSIDFRSPSARDDLDGAAGGLPGRPPGAATAGGPARPAREGGGGAGSPRQPGRGRRG